jgi:WhiB family redox-sensing transcriptional regulator
MSGACEAVHKRLTGGFCVSARGTLLLESSFWRNTASCRDADPTLFFPVGTTGAALDQIAAAKSVCDACDAKDLCLEFALNTNQDSGVWGGTSEEERRQIRRERNASRRRAS